MPLLRSSWPMPSSPILIASLNFLSVTTKTPNILPQRSWWPKANADPHPPHPWLRKSPPRTPLTIRRSPKKASRRRQKSRLLLKLFEASWLSLVSRVGLLIPRLLGCFLQRLVLKSGEGGEIKMENKRKPPKSNLLAEIAVYIFQKVHLACYCLII